MLSGQLSLQLLGGFSFFDKHNTFIGVEINHVGKIFLHGCLISCMLLIEEAHLLNLLVEANGVGDRDIILSLINFKVISLPLVILVQVLLLFDSLLCGISRLVNGEIIIRQ